MLHGGDLPSLAASLALAALLSESLLAQRRLREMAASPAALLLLLSAAGMATQHLAAESACAAWLNPLAALDLHHWSGGALLAPWLGALAAAVWAGSLHPTPLGAARAVAVSAGALLLCATGRRWAPRALTPHTAALVWLLSVAHLFGCALDCSWRGGRLRRPSWRSAADFARRIAVSLAYVAPAAVLIVLASSVCLLVASSLLKLVGLRPERLRPLVLWGALHSPFWIVHVETRRSYGGHERAVVGGYGGSRPRGWRGAAATTPPPLLPLTTAEWVLPRVGYGASGRRDARREEPAAAWPSATPMRGRGKEEEEDDEMPPLEPIPL